MKTVQLQAVPATGRVLKASLRSLEVDSRRFEH